MEAEMVSSMTWVDQIRPWEDSGPDGWRQVMAEVIGPQPDSIAIERNRVPALVRNALDEGFAGLPLTDVSPLLAAQRMIKAPDEVAIMHQTGRVAVAMMKAAENSLAEDVPEYESALAVIEAGTRAAAGLLSTTGWEAFVSPVIHNLQIMQSGRDTAMVHRRASTKRYQKGDPVYFCLCNMAEFKHYRLGFDRMFYIGEISDEAARVQQTAIDAQQAALAVIRPGVRAEEVAFAANEVYQAQGYQAGYRTGRAIGLAYLEAPELKGGDTTVLRQGMTFAVDGGVSAPGECGGRIGDSIVVTDQGYEYLTEYPRQITVV
jgi:Xaa-Pro aminopeptidase